MASRGLVVDEVAKKRKVEHSRRLQHQSIVISANSTVQHVKVDNDFVKIHAPFRMLIAGSTHYNSFKRPQSSKNFRPGAKYVLLRPNFKTVATAHSLGCDPMRQDFTCQTPTDT